MQLDVAPLPYSMTALEPHISGRTLSIHYEKHHKGYLEKLRKQIEGKPEADLEWVELIRTAGQDVFNNAAQVWNHTFYWRSMSPDFDQKPTNALSDRLSQAFGSVGNFKQEFATAANGEFGSGWAWLVAAPDGRLRVVSSSDAENPLQSGATPLLALDVWEHAYYLDYQNDRASYVEGFLDHLIDWAIVASRLEAVES